MDSRLLMYIDAQVRTGRRGLFWYQNSRAPLKQRFRVFFRNKAGFEIQQQSNDDQN